MAKYKGISYVTKALRKYAGKKYTSQKVASKKAKIIVGKLKKKKEKVTVKNILSFVTKKKVSKKKTGKSKGKPKKEAPILDAELIGLTHYFNLQDYMFFIQRMPQEPALYFTSKIIPEGLPDLYAGFQYDYNDYFAPFVNYINKLQADSPEGKYEDEWFVRCTEPTWNRTLNTWASRIISCDSEGNEFDYGFDAKEPEISEPTTVKEKPVKEKPKTEAPAPEKPKEGPPAPVKEQALEIEKEKTKQKEAEAKIAQFQAEKSKTILEAMKMLKDKTITSSQFDDIIRSLG